MSPTSCSDLSHACCVGLGKVALLEGKELMTWKEKEGRRKSTQASSLLDMRRKIQRRGEEKGRKIATLWKSACSSVWYPHSLYGAS